MVARTRRLIIFGGIETSMASVVVTVGAVRRMMVVTIVPATETFG